MPGAQLLMHITDWEYACILQLLGVLQANLNSLSYAIMWKYAERQMAVGRAIIVDCPLARRELFDTGNALATKVGPADWCMRRLSCPASGPPASG